MINEKFRPAVNVQILFNLVDLVSFLLLRQNKTDHIIDKAFVSFSFHIKEL